MESEIKILHLEDNPADAEIIERVLRKSNLKFSIQIAESKKQYVDALDHFKPDVILSDHSLPQFNSLDAIKIYKEHLYEIPFILITGTVSEEFAITSIKEGADDYILKSNLIRLPSAIEQALKVRKIEREKRRANSELELINKELNTFIYKAAHDLRGPVCSIIGLVDIASQTTEANDLSPYIQKISMSAHRLDSILLSLLEVMSIKNTVPVIAEINVKKTINDIITRVKEVETCTGIEFELNINSSASFFSDEAILKSILYSIVENAVKFNDTRKLSSYINISLIQSEKEVIIQIKDNGIGIDKKNQASIFDMYYRGNEFSKGSGLGLYLAKSAVKKLDGAIKVDSEPNEGSVFTLLFPYSNSLKKEN